MQICFLRLMLRLVLLAALSGTTLTAVLRAEEPPKPSAGEVRLEGGHVVDYTIHFDRNALRDSLRFADGLIALTSSGALLRFELPTVGLVRDRVDAEEVSCLGRGEGDEVLVGLSDGRVCRVDPAALDLIEVARLPSTPQWVGWGPAGDNRPAGMVVVTRQTRAGGRNGEDGSVPCSVVHDLATGKTFALKEEGTPRTGANPAKAFLLDRKGRVWLGADHGEWGGRVTRVDLNQGTVTEIKPPGPGAGSSWPEGVYGFVELSQGQVWAFGGTMHMGATSADITRIDDGEARRVFAGNNHAHLLDDPDKRLDPAWPELPITHVIEESGGLLVLSYSDVFRVEKALRSWKHVATLEIQYRSGRADAVGAYPSVSAIHPPKREGEPYILATVGDGYVFMDRLAIAGPTQPSKVMPLTGSSHGARPAPELKMTAHGLPAQLGAANVYRVENTSEGTFFFEEGTLLPAWRLGAKGWEIAEIEPPFEPDPPAEAARVKNGEATEKGSGGGWSSTQVLVGSGGTISTISGTSWDEGTRTTARWVDSKSVTIGRETSSLVPSTTFLTPDGTLWSAHSGVLKRFDKGRWETVAQSPQRNSPLSLKATNANGPPWMLLNGDSANLWRLDLGEQGNQPQLTPVEITNDGKTLRVDDAIPWSDNSLLLATDAGLRTYFPGARKLSRVDLPEPPQPATTLVRDGLGRLWMGGGSIWTARISSRGLWLYKPGAKGLVAFDSVPWVGHTEVYALAPDRQHVDGVIAALGSRGIAFVRAKQ